jgi:hypothetical protein
MFTGRTTATNFLWEMGNSVVRHKPADVAIARNQDSSTCKLELLELLH